MPEQDPKHNDRPILRCAIYTRKSHEDGLEQEFNSLDAQREACEAYIRSQASRGWEVIADHYDDGGFSGGTMERPALRSLLKDIEAGKINVIVVYKIDRLSRSLIDFFRMIELFEGLKVSFVSVTEQFNTTDSSGRLMLGILMSFAQYEREIAGERIRDKVAAAKRRGKWCGGTPPLGYDVDHNLTRLVLNESEAKIIRRIFKRFIQTGSTMQVARELNADGLTTKSWTTQKGKLRKGNPWTISALYRIIKNRIYLGEVEYKDHIYPGEHEAIITHSVWKQAQELLEDNHRTRRHSCREKTNAPLRGLIRCGHCESAMGPTYTNRHGRQYHYYLCQTAAKRGKDICPVSRVAAGEVEKVVLEQLGAVFRTPALVAKTYRSARKQEDEDRRHLTDEQTRLKSEIKTSQDEAIELMRSGDNPERVMELNAKTSGIGRDLDQIEHKLAGYGSAEITERDVAEAFASLEELWDMLYPIERQRLMQILIDKVTVWHDGIDLKLKALGIANLVAELNGYVNEASQREAQA